MCWNAIAGCCNGGFKPYADCEREGGVVHNFRSRLFMQFIQSLLWHSSRASKHFEADLLTTDYQPYSSDFCEFRTCCLCHWNTVLRWMGNPKLYPNLKHGSFSMVMRLRCLYVWKKRALLLWSWTGEWQGNMETYSCNCSRDDSLPTIVNGTQVHCSIDKIWRALLMG
jgi:hypothetical protein